MMSRLVIVASSLYVGSGITLREQDRFLASEHLGASQEIDSKLEVLAQSLVTGEYDENSPALHASLKEIQGHMDINAAMRSVAKMSLPNDVRALMQHKSTTHSGTQRAFDETAMEKARVILNDLVIKAWHELDDKIIQCKEYQEMNRATFDQVVTDISRLVEQITDLERIETEATEGIAKTEAEIKEIEEELTKEIATYYRIHAKNDEELTIRQNDLDVWNFILQMTRDEGGCGDGTVVPSPIPTVAPDFLQMNVNRTSICSIVKTGEKTMCFGDAKTQNRFNHGLSKAGFRRMSHLLAQIEAGQGSPVSLLQMSQEPVATTTENPAISQASAIVVEPIAGQDMPMPKGFIPAPFCCEAHGVACGPTSGGIICNPTEVDHCLLHDKLALMWGDYRDLVDELTMEMQKNLFEFEELKWTLNQQIKVLVNTKARFSMLLAETRSNLAEDRQMLKDKITQRNDVEKAYKKFMKACCARVKWIMFQDMCAIIVVRNAVLKDSEVCDGDTIVDCEVDYWTNKACTVECDDTCPEVPQPSEVYECGGWMEIYRKIVSKETLKESPADGEPPECGVPCARLDMVRTQKCNQKKCEVDCVMSEWSGWSKCTADCEGGVRSQTRSIITKPLNGGRFCNTNEESEPCNTMSCDRDCTLTGWQPWSPCSVACGGGMQSRDTHVIIPIRGFGKCPAEHSPQRFEEQQCNTHSCVGDEICIAKQDLILALDASGSLRENGFRIIRDFALDVLTKYRSTYFDATAMKVGVVLFGNGKLDDSDGTIEAAINLQGLTTDLAAVRTAIEGAQHKGGFTNMGQAAAMAKNMFIHGGRGDAQPAVMFITDGKPTLEFQGGEMMEQLDDKGVQRFFVVVSDDEKNVDLMKKWASAPWETNLLHVPSLTALEADLGVWTQKALTLFCPQAVSMSLMEVKETQGGYKLIKEGGYCGGRGMLLSTAVADAEGCAFLAQGAGATSFLLGTWFRRGYCYAGQLEVTSSIFDAWIANRVTPQCPSEGGGAWTPSMIYDFYSLIVSS